MPRLELDALCGVGSNHPKTYHPQEWAAPVGYRIVGRPAIILTLLSALTFYSIWAEGFHHPSSGRPNRLESEDFATPWFCPKPSFVTHVVGFPIGLSPRTIVLFLPFLRYFTTGRSGGCPRPRLFLDVGRSPWAPMQNGPGPRIH